MKVVNLAILCILMIKVRSSLTVVSLLFCELGEAEAEAARRRKGDCLG
jgi:hypothetical protein